MHVIGVHKVLRRFFHGVKCPGYRDLNKCQIPAHPVLNSCQMPGGCRGGMGTLGFDSYITMWGAAAAGEEFNDAERDTWSSSEEVCVV